MLIETLMERENKFNIGNMLRSYTFHNESYIIEGETKFEKKKKICHPKSVLESVSHNRIS